jgi:hypothetical protein
MFYFSPELVTALKNLDENRRPEIVAAIRQRLKCIETYKLLMLLFGILGVHKLYLKETGSMLLRINYFVASFAAAVSGLYFSNYTMLGVSLVLALITLSVWLFDVFTPKMALQRYHGRIERRVLTWYRQS